MYILKGSFEPFFSGFSSFQEDVSHVLIGIILFLTGQIVLQLTVPHVTTIHGLPYNIVVPNKVTGLLQTHFYLHLVLDECEFWTL